MIGYYFLDSRKNVRLFIPRNMLVVIAKTVDSDFSPAFLSNPERFLKRNKKSLERGLIAVVNIPDEDLSKFQYYCFIGNHYSAELKALEIFHYVQSNWRKLKVAG